MCCNNSKAVNQKLFHLSKFFLFILLMNLMILFTQIAFLIFILKEDRDVVKKKISFFQLRAV